MELVNIGRIAPQRGWRMPWHVHRDYHELIVVVQGRLETGICGERISGGPGDLLFYPCGERHVETAAGRGALETYFLAWRGEEDFSKWPLVQRDFSGHVEHAVRWMYELAHSAHRGDAAPRLALLGLIVHELSNAPRSTENQVILRVQHHVQQHLAERLNLEELAEVAGMSRFHFARVFAAATGTSPMLYVRESRVRAARTLLQTTPLPLRTIAGMVGFGDQPQLSRVFLQVVGQTPGEFRRWSGEREH